MLYFPSILSFVTVLQFFIKEKKNDEGENAQVSVKRVRRKKKW